RLDMDSDGLLLMTNDAGLIHKLTHPSYQVEKEYHVRIKPGTDAAEAARALSLPMEIEGRAIKPAAARDIAKDVVSVIIHEGRKRQIRKMCAQNGIGVLRLTRVREGGVLLGALKPGQWRYLTQGEIKELT
ncbi:MAG: pseudouridine synthase, partial [Oscillospiraceae bacterium]|nr:pseudouridine synthase [Oscillospiraceae bacterium]